MKKKSCAPLLNASAAVLATMEEAPQRRAHKKSDGVLVNEMESFFELHFVEDQNPKLHAFVHSPSGKRLLSA